MRRSIALIALVAFLVSIVVSGAAGVLPDSPYINSIPEKVKQFDLGKYDLMTKKNLETDQPQGSSFSEIPKSDYSAF